MMLEFDYGGRKMYIRPPIIREKLIKRRFWFNKTEFYVDWEYCTLGPFKTYEEANDTIPKEYLK